METTSRLQLVTQRPQFRAVRTQHHRELHAGRDDRTARICFSSGRQYLPPHVDPCEEEQLATQGNKERRELRLGSRIGSFICLG